MDGQVKSIVTQPQPLPSIVVDPWAQSRAAALENQLQLQGNPAELPEVARGVGQPLRAPHPKEVERPTKYDGSSAQWRLWSASFEGEPAAAVNEAQWWTALKLGPDPILKWNSQLNEFLETYTKGSARETVDSRGERNALDAWGSLADRTFASG